MPVYLWWGKKLSGIYPRWAPTAQMKNTDPQSTGNKTDLRLALTDLNENLNKRFFHRPGSPTPHMPISAWCGPNATMAAWEDLFSTREWRGWAHPRLRASSPSGHQPQAWSSWMTSKCRRKTCYRMCTALLWVFTVDGQQSWFKNTV